MKNRAAIFSITVFFLLVFLFLPNLANARPKIALVLGGGGARGAAHVGVLKVLEANHVPVDFIVGTSMGSIVGGMYASGYSPEEIEQLFKDINWNDMLSDRPSEDVLPFRNKKDFQRLSNLEMGFNKGKLSFPRGVISGQKLDFMLSKLTIHTVEAQSFDELRIPFRAVATDAVTGEMVVFDKGSLAEAIRASMSVPGAFPPVKMGNKLLVDGFLSKNVPVEVAKAWGADIIITVNVDAPLMKEDELNNLLALSGQMFAILSKKNVDESIALLTDKDILIHPLLQGVGPGDFVKTPQAAKMGEEEALKHVDSMKRYSVSDQDFQAFLAHQRVRTRNPIMIDEIRVTKPKRVNEGIIRGRTKTRAGQQLDFNQLERDLTNIYAIGDFETVGFDVKKEENKNVLLVNTKEKSWGPEYLRFGFNMQGDTQGINNSTILLDYRHTQLNRLGGEWKVVGAVGQNTGVGTELYQPLDEENYFFIAPSLIYNVNHQMLYDAEDHKTSDYRTTEAGAGVDLGINLKTYLEARIGLRSSEISAKPDIGDPDLPSYDHVNKTGMLAQVNFDQLDDHRFPTKGIKMTSKFFMSDENMGSHDGYEKLDFTVTKATTFGERHTFITAMQGGISPDDDLPYYDKFTAGGFLRLSGLGEGQLRGKNMGVADLIYLYKLVDTKGFANKIYLGSSFEAGNVWEDKDNFGDDLIYSGSLFLGVDTILGPLYIGYGKADSHEGRGFIYLGKTF